MIKKLIALLVSLSFTVQANEVRSIHQFYPEEKTYVDKRIEGVWLGPLNDTLTISRGGDNFYLLRDKKQNVESEFEAAFFTLDDGQGSETFVNIYPKTRIANNLFENSHIFKGHSVYKIHLEDSACTLYPLNFSWFQNLTRKTFVTLQESIVNFMITRIRRY